MQDFEKEVQKKAATLFQVSQSLLGPTTIGNENNCAVEMTPVGFSPRALQALLSSPAFTSKGSNIEKDEATGREYDSALAAYASPDLLQSFDSPFMSFRSPLSHNYSVRTEEPVLHEAALLRAFRAPLFDAPSKPSPRSWDSLKSDVPGGMSYPSVTLQECTSVAPKGFGVMLQRFFNPASFSANGSRRNAVQEEPEMGGLERRVQSTSLGVRNLSPKSALWSKSAPQRRPQVKLGMEFDSAECVECTPPLSPSAVFQSPKANMLQALRFTPADLSPPVSPRGGLQPKAKATSKLSGVASKDFKFL